MNGFRYLKDVSTLALDAGSCVGCGRCVEVCPHTVFSLQEGRARVEDLDACMECGACATNCPAGALRVDAGVGCAAGLMTEWLRERRARPAGACSG